MWSPCPQLSRFLSSLMTLFPRQGAFIVPHKPACSLTHRPIKTQAVTFFNQRLRTTGIAVDAAAITFPANNAHSRQGHSAGCVPQHVAQARSELSGCAPDTRPRISETLGGRSCHNKIISPGVPGLNLLTSFCSKSETFRSYQSNGKDSLFYFSLAKTWNPPTPQKL